MLKCCLNLPTFNYDMVYYKFTFTGDYHIKDDGTHEVTLIQRDLDGVEVAFCEGDIVPEYGIEITSEEMPKSGISALV